MKTYKIIATRLGLLVAAAETDKLIGLYWINQLLDKNLITDSTKSKITLKIKSELELALSAKHKGTFKEFSEDPLLLDTELQLQEYLEGNRRNFTLPIKTEGTEFQIKTWNELKKIPFGKTRSYLEQSKKLNRPKAYRAVGTANSKNPISIIIPCHRVISNNGSISGYAGGIDKKIALLKLESNSIKEL